MQTFLPFADFAECARVLDYRRLGKQRAECIQILDALCGVGWVHHPATITWETYEPTLIDYGIAICLEWVLRGYSDDGTLEKIISYSDGRERVDPWWLGDERLHSSHRSNLLRKDFNHYSAFDWSEPTDLRY